MKYVTIYTIPGCPYCIKAKDLLKKKHINYEEIIVEKEEDRVKMMTKTGGKRSVPQIFIDGKLIGGYEELRKFYELKDE